MQLNNIFFGKSCVYIKCVLNIPIPFLQNCKPTNDNVFFSKHKNTRPKSQDVIKMRNNIDKYVNYMTDYS